MRTDELLHMRFGDQLAHVAVSALPNLLGQPDQSLVLARRIVADRTAARVGRSAADGAAFVDEQS